MIAYFANIPKYAIMRKSMKNTRKNENVNSNFILNNTQIHHLYNAENRSKKDLKPSEHKKKSVARVVGFSALESSFPQ